MLKLSTSYSKKIPVEGQDYSSQSFHAAVELELSDSLQPPEIKARIHETFEMVKNAVEAELNGQSGQPAPSTAPTAPPPASHSTPDKATNAQIKFITDLSRNLGYSLAEVNARVLELYHVQSIYDLTKRDASKLVDDMKRSGRRKAAGNTEPEAPRTPTRWAWPCWFRSTDGTPDRPRRTWSRARCRWPRCRA